jgi:hypothetical protein
MSLTLRPLIAALSLFLLTDCASSFRGARLDPLPKDLPAELQAKFEVVEAGAVPTPAPSPSPSAVPEKLSKKKQKAQAAKAKAAPVFVFPERRPKVDPVWVGEKQTLEITYIGLAAGEFTMEVLPNKKIGTRDVYHLKGSAKSSSVMNLFYRLNDTVESFWDYRGIFSHRFHMLLDQTRQTRDALELFDSEKKQVFYSNRRNHIEKGYSESKEYMDMVPFPQDSFSAIYYVRTLPLEDGQVYSFPVVSEGRGWECVVTVVRREMMDTPLGKVRTIVLKPQTRYQGVMKQEHGDSFIWVTDDERRFIVRLEAKVKVGSVAASLKKVELGEKPNSQ